MGTLQLLEPYVWHFLTEFESRILAFVLSFRKRLQPYQIRISEHTRRPTALIMCTLIHCAEAQEPCHLCLLSRKYVDISAGASRISTTAVDIGTEAMPSPTGYML